jgi:integrase
VTVQTLLGLVEKDYRVNGKRSLRTMLCAQKPVLRYFSAGRIATDLTAGDLKAYRDARLSENAQPATVNRELSCLRRGYSLARRDGLLDSAPVFAMLEEDNLRTGFFEEHERQAVLKALPADLSALARFLSLTSWRLGEALSLTWAQVDLVNGVIRLEPGATKNGDGRTFPFALLPRIGDAHGGATGHDAFAGARAETHHPFGIPRRRRVDLGQALLSAVVAGRQSGEGLSRVDGSAHREGQAWSHPA